MQQEPYIKLFLRLGEWRWHKEPATLSFWIHALIFASHKKTPYRDLTLERGQFSGTLDEWHFATGLSVRQIRTAIEHLTSTGEIVTQATNKYTLITICNYERYQNIFESSDKRATNECQTNDIQTSNGSQTSDIYNKNNRIIDNKENKEQQQKNAEPNFFHNVEECKAFLVANGRGGCSDEGYTQFYRINQEGTKKNKPYWYVDGVLQSFDNFIQRDSNKRFRTNETKGKNPPGSARPPNAPLWQTSPHEYWNIHIGNISKKVWADEANLINTLEFKGISDKNELIITSPRMNEIQSSKTLLSMINGEFRGMKFKIV